jgi:hypothetical protein
LTALLPDGVHLNLAPEDYFGQGLGSSDLMTLASKGTGFWWGSPNNPRWTAPKPSAERTYGSALHSILLEGVEAYERRFSTAPEKEDFPNLCTSTDDIKQALDRMGFDVSTGKSKWKADDWRTAAAQQGVNVWATIEAQFQESLIIRHADGSVKMRREAISAGDDWTLRFMRDMALDATRSDNQEVRHLFDLDGDHPPICEVSILKTMPDGIRRRWRIDRMFPSFDVDLKSLGNHRGQSLPWLTGEEIARRNYDIQRADYLEARRTAYEFIQDGFQVYGGTIEQRNFLRQFPEIAPSWNWIWLFYQKPDAASAAAPIIFPVMDITADPSGEPSVALRAGEAKRQRALQLYRDCVATWGLDQPWGSVSPVHYTDEAYEPRVFLPSYIFAPEDRPNA